MSAWAMSGGITKVLIAKLKSALAASLVYRLRKAP